jgi:hypothetical protein
VVETEVRRQLDEMKTQPALAKKMVLSALGMSRRETTTDPVAAMLIGTLRSVAILLGATEAEINGSR